MTHDNEQGVHFFQMVPFIVIALAIMATVRCVRSRQQGLALILWLLFIWLVPVIGACVALFALRHAHSTS